VQFHLQHYTEPAASSQAPDPILTSASTLNSTVLPLGLGTLTHNPAGVPIIIACTKSDLIDEEEDVGIGMVKGKGGEWEERTDGIMQVLRTMSLKCERIVSFYYLRLLIQPSF
jgi:dynein light intermediate chain 1